MENIMGYYIDKGFESFRRIVSGGFVDKSMLIDFLNKFIDKERCYLCVSRPRRFGKSVAAKMVYAYL